MDFDFPLSSFCKANDVEITFTNDEEIVFEHGTWTVGPVGIQGVALGQRLFFPWSVIRCVREL